ncbi:unnamed protein product, partial [Larinioides sclopetarius]
MERAGKRKHSPVAPAKSSSSSRVTETEPGTQKKRANQLLDTGSAINVKKKVSVQDPTPSGQSEPPSVIDSTGYECIICLESTSLKEMKTLQCSHAFHRPCIDLWLEEERRCPICRRYIVLSQNARPLQQTVPPQNARR